MTSSIAVDFAARGTPHKGIIYIKDGIAILRCEDWRVAKQMFDAESKDPNAKIRWDEKKKVMLEFFPSQKEADIVTELKARIANLKRM
jgi:hypothetical protein